MKKRLLTLIAAALISCCAFAERYVVFTNPAVLWKPNSLGIPVPHLAVKGDVFAYNGTVLFTSIYPVDCKFIKPSDGSFSVSDLTTSYIIVNSYEALADLDIDNIDYHDYYTSCGHNVTHPDVLIDMMSK